MKKRLTILCILTLAVLMLPIPLHAAGADDADNAAPTPAQSYNIGAEYYDRYGEPVNSYLVRSDDGNFVRVEYLETEGTICVETYSDTFGLLSSATIVPELPRFGGFFAGKDRYYLIVGQNNPDESDDTEVIRVIEYDKDWRRLSHASLFGANTYIPFDAGSLRCAEADGYLYIRTCHEMYESGDGLHHQANLTMVVKEDDMTVVGSVYGIAGLYMTYASHSFNQFALADKNGDLVFLDHGDAYPRAAVLFKLPKGEDRSEIDWYSCEYRNLIDFPGQLGDNETGCALGGLEESAEGYLAVGDLNALIKGDASPETWRNCMIRNAFVCYIDRSLSEEPVVHFLTDFDGGTAESPLVSGESASAPHIVKFSDDRFLVLWNVGQQHYDWFRPDNRIEYVFVNGKGEPLGSVRRIDGALSDCKPVLIDGKAYWYVTDYLPTFYCMDADGNLDRIWCAQPELIKGTLNEDGLPYLNWRSIDGAEAYEIYVSESADGTYKLLATVNEQVYVHRTAKKQHTYYYKIYAVDGASRKSRASVVYPIAVPKNLSVAVQPKNRTVREGEKVKFTAKGSSTGLHYQWYFRKPGEEWKAVAGAAGRKATYTLTATAAKNGYAYRCRIDSAEEAVYTDVASLTVMPIEIEITVQPESATAAIGKTVKFKVKAVNLKGEGLKYQWYYRTSSKAKWKQAVGSSATKPTYWFKTTEKKNGYEYRCKVTSANDAVYTDTVRLKTGAAPKIAVQPTNKSVKTKAKVKLKVEATGKSLTYQWYYRTSSTAKWKKATGTSATKATYRFTATAKKNGYQYRCLIKNPFGKVYTKAVKLKVR